MKTVGLEDLDDAYEIISSAFYKGFDFLASSVLTKRVTGSHSYDKQPGGLEEIKPRDTC